MIEKAERITGIKPVLPFELRGGLEMHFTGDEIGLRHKELERLFDKQILIDVYCFHPVGYSLAFDRQSSIGPMCKRGFKFREDLSIKRKWKRPFSEYYDVDKSKARRFVAIRYNRQAELEKYDYMWYLERWEVLKGKVVGPKRIGRFVNSAIECGYFPEQAEDVFVFD